MTNLTSVCSSPTMNPSSSPIGVLQTRPLSVYIQNELSKRFTLHKLWEIPQNSRTQFFDKHSDSIRAVVGNAVTNADSNLIDSLPRLEIVSNHGSGLDKIDLDKCRERGIRVTYTPDALTDEVADMAILLTIATLRRICEADRYVRRREWKNNGEFKLTKKFSGKSVGIIGLGRIGSAIAKRCESFDCSIAYNSRSQKQNLKYKYYPSALELASHSQILIVSCELNHETRHIIDRHVLDALGPAGVLINIGRGAHIDEPELVSALMEGRLGGAGLDVLENEPEVPEGLLGLDNVVLSPHVGTCTVETRKAMADLVVRNLEAHFSNEPLLTPVFCGLIHETSAKFKCDEKIWKKENSPNTDSELIDLLLCLEIVSSHSPGLDKIDLERCTTKNDKLFCYGEGDEV